MPSIPIILAIATSSKEVAAKPDVAPTDGASSHTVFVSHAHADNELADRYVQALKDRGLAVWYDRNNLQGGQRLSKEIETQLKQRSAFVVLLTPASVDSYWVEMETSAFRSLAAKDASRLLLPVRIADCDVPLLMQGLFWIDALALGFDATTDALAKALRAPHAPASSVEAPDSGPPVALQPASVDDLIAQAVEIGAQRECEKSLTAFDRALALDPKNAEMWINKGAALVCLKRYDEALAAYERALALHPDDVVAWNNKADVLYHLGRYREAMSACDRALAGNPYLPFVLQTKREVMQAIVRTAEAEAADKRARELE